MPDTRNLPNQGLLTANSSNLGHHFTELNYTRANSDQRVQQHEHFLGVEMPLSMVPLRKLNLDLQQPTFHQTFVKSTPQLVPP